MQGAGGVGGLLMTKEASESYLPAYDAMGNVHAMIRASDGTIAAAYEYDAFGRTVRKSGSYAGQNPFRFSTKYTDETGLLYYGLRYYHPATGRFINRDPIGEAGGLNLYGFVGNNAVNGWDYLGLNKDVQEHSGSAGRHWSNGRGPNIDGIELPEYVVNETRILGPQNTGGGAGGEGTGVVSGSSSPENNDSTKIDETTDESARKKTQKELECEGLLQQAQDAQSRSVEALNNYEKYRSDPDRIKRLNDSRQLVMTRKAYAWAVVTSGLSAIPAGNIFESTKHGGVIADIEFARQAGVDVLNGVYGGITAASYYDITVAGVGSASTVMDVGARVATTSFGGARAVAFAGAVSKVNPYFSVASSFGATLSATETYSKTNRDFDILERLQQETLDGFVNQANSFGKSAESLLSLWRQKDCDKL